jgi:hypothetical protein
MQRSNTDVHVDWGPTVRKHLARWQQPDLQSADFDRAERWALTGAMKNRQVPGSWRLRVINGSMYVKILKSSAHWQERSNVLRMLYGVHASRSLPDLDVVYIHSDLDPGPARHTCVDNVWPRYNATTQAVCGRQVPLLTNSYRSSGGLGRASIPLPDFTWVGWNKQPSWCVLSRRLRAVAARQPFSTRDDRLYFAGSLSNGPQRQQVARLARDPAAADVLAIYDVASRFFNPVSSNGSIRQRPNEEACGFKYLLSVSGFGYSSRLRQLLMCGSVVFHIRTPFNEFFMPELEPGVHYVAVGSVNLLLPALRIIRADPARAARIGAAAGKAARRLLSYGSAQSYVRQLLTELAARRRGEPVVLGRVMDRPGTVSGYTKLTSEASIMPVVRQCNCGMAYTRGSVGVPPSTHTSVSSNGEIHWRYRKGVGGMWENGSSICPEQPASQCCDGHNCATSHLGC